MPRKCKICESELRAELEQQICTGDSTKAVAEYATEHGLKISHMVVQRHKDHIENYEPPQTEKQGINADDYEAEPVLIDMPVFENGHDLLEYSKETARAILANQLAIIRKKQELFMRGEGRYPMAEMSALKTFTSCIDVLVADNKGVFKDKNKKDVQ